MVDAKYFVAGVFSLLQTLEVIRVPRGSQADQAGSFCDIDDFNYDMKVLLLGRFRTLT